MRRVRVVGKALVLFVVGLVLAFYPVFLVIFSDKRSTSDYVTGLVVVGVAFLIIAGISALLLRSWRYPVWLTVPAVLVLMSYSLQETQQIQYHVAVFLVLVAGTALGAVAGSRLRGPQRPGAPI